LTSPTTTSDGSPRHGAHRRGDPSDVVVGDVNLVSLGQHAQHSLAQGEEIDIVFGQRQRHRIHDELVEPFAEHRSPNRSPKSDATESISINVSLTSKTSTGGGTATAPSSSGRECPIS